MQQTIRIGTYLTKSALWQANLVAKKLQEIEDLEIKTEIVKIDPQNGVDLDSALLKNQIDIAVHSMEDIPMLLPEKIVQAAVLKRAGSLDVLICRDVNDEEFLYQKEAVIATESLCRKAQWLHHYPTHTVVDLQENLEVQIQKLKESNWNGAIFSQAALHRSKLLPKKNIPLNWMTPAPTQGIVAVMALEENTEILKICKEIHHNDTQICSYIERQFLNTLENRFEAPIGALAYIKETKIVFKGVLFSLDGKRKIEIDKSCYMVEHDDLGKRCAADILERGGKRLLAEILGKEKQITVLSTKQLALSQTDLFSDKIGFKMSDFVAIKFNRLKPSIVKNTLKNVVITNQNAVEALLQNFSPSELNFESIYCVGRRTKRLIEKKFEKKVTHIENSIKELADFLVKMRLKKVTYFCGSPAQGELIEILSKNDIKVTEIEAYRTVLNERKFEDEFDGILLYSPSGVESFLMDNKPMNAIAFCIGESTANEAKKHFEKVEIATLPTIESVIKLANKYFEKV